MRATTNRRNISGIRGYTPALPPMYDPALGVYDPRVRESTYPDRRSRAHDTA